MESTVFLHIASLFVLLLLSAFFSGSEAAVFSLSHLRIRRLASEKLRFSGLLSRLLSNPQRTLINILLGNTLANVGASFFAALLSFRLAEAVGIDQALVMAFGVGVMTFLLLVFGEISPKWYSLERAERMSMRVSPVLTFFSIIFWPVSYLLELVVGRGVRGVQGRGLVTMDEIKTMLEMGKETKTLRAFEEEIIRNVFDFPGTTAREIMIPRTDMLTMPRSLSVAEALSLARQRRHSRIPVYDENIDDIVGILYIKDVLTRQVPGGAPVLNLVKPAYFVPETMSIGELLKQFQGRRIHIAIVVDEHGGTVGLVTLDDVLSEIVGDIAEDRRASEKPEIVALSENEFLVAGHASLDDLKGRFGFNLPAQDFDTLSGLVYDLAGKVPVEGQRFVYRETTFEVQEMQGTRIARVKITKAG